MKHCLIGGPPTAGKTILSERLVRDHGYFRIPGDALVLAFERAFPELGIGHERSLYDSSRKQFGRFLVQLVNALAWESPPFYVVDTFHVWPGDLAGIDRSKAIVLFLGYPQADARDKTRCTKEYKGQQDGELTGWVAESLDAVAARFTLFIEMSCKIRDECAVWHFPFVDTGQAFEEAISRAVAQVVSQGGHQT